MNKETQAGLIKALKCSHKELQDLFKAAIREAVILEDENDRLKQCLKEIINLANKYE